MNVAVGVVVALQLAKNVFSQLQIIFSTSHRSSKMRQLIIFDKFVD